MRKTYLFKTIFVFFICLLSVFLGSLATSFLENRQLQAQEWKKNIAAYYQKAKAFRPSFRPGFRHLVKIDITILNDKSRPQGKVMEVEFDGKKLPLWPTGPYGRRGRKYLAVQPGIHIIKWKVENNRLVWPRYTTYKKIIRVEDEDVWIHILIKGSEITVN